MTSCVCIDHIGISRMVYLTASVRLVDPNNHQKVSLQNILKVFTGTIVPKRYIKRSCTAICCNNDRIINSHLLTSEIFGP